MNKKPVSDVLNRRNKIYLLTGILVLFFAVACLNFVKSRLWTEKPLGLETQKTQQQNLQEPSSPQEMVNLQLFIPGIYIDLRYAGNQNVFGEKIYKNGEAFLRLGTAKKLKAAQEEFRQKGYSLKIWDAYRSPEAQFKLWKIMPDARFVVNPNTGYSYHSKGVAVDLTLVDKNGNELPMPSGFDNFTGLANRDYSDVEKVRADNARLLESVMVKHGFISIYYEWWHFVDADRDQYEVVKNL